MVDFEAKSAHQTRRKVVVTLLTLLGAALYLPRLSAYPLWDPWEPHYLQVAWEMHQNGEWWDPSYRGRPWWSKPILLPALLRASLLAFWHGSDGLAATAFAGRLPIAMSAVCGAILTFDWSRRLYGSFVATIAAVALLTCPQWIGLGRLVMVDVPHAVASSAALGYLAVSLFAAREGRGARRAIWGFWALLAVAVLAKGFVAPVLSAAILAAFSAHRAITRRSCPDPCGVAPMLAKLSPGRGLALFFAIAGPWFLFMSLRHGLAYWSEFIGYHHLGRAAGSIGKAPGDPAFYLRTLAAALFPWSGVVVVALIAARPRWKRRSSLRHDRDVFVWLCAIVPLLVFTAARTHFAHYIAPALPFFCVIAGRGLRLAGRHRPSLAAHGAVIVLTGAIALELSVDYRAILRTFVYYGSRPLPDDLQSAAGVLGSASLVVITVVASWFVHRHRTTLLLLYALGAIWSAAYLSWLVFPGVATTYSLTPLILQYDDIAAEGQPLGNYNDWQLAERSVSFLAGDRGIHLRSDAEAIHFLSNPQGGFILASESDIARLTGLADGVEATLHVVSRAHPNSVLLAVQAKGPPPLSAEELPADLEHRDAIFGDAIRMHGWRFLAPLDPREGSIDIEFYFSALRPIDSEWQLLVQGVGNDGQELFQTSLPSRARPGFASQGETGSVFVERLRLKPSKLRGYQNVTLWLSWGRGAERLTVSDASPSDLIGRARGPSLTVVDD